MSAEGTFWAWSMGVKPSGCKLVLLCLGDCHNSDTGRCDPSNPFIATFTGLDEKTVVDSIKRLVLMGLITYTSRVGTSNMYQLKIENFPAPVRKPGERRKVLKIKRAPQLREPRKRVPPPKPAPPKTGSMPPPEQGGGPPPKPGTEPTSKPTREPTILPVACATAAGAAPSVDNSLVNLKAIYSTSDPRSTVFEVGVPMIMRGGYDRHQARNLLAKLMNDHGEGRMLDALVVTLLENPKEAKPYLIAVAKKIGDEIPKDWEPPAPCLSEIAALGIPDYLMVDARDIFVTWFRSQGIRHTNWPGLFVRWCQGDWDRVQENKHAYRQRLWAASGLTQDEVKTSWGATM